MPQKGLRFVHGTSGEVYDVPPRSQQILMVVLSDGRSNATAVSVVFSFASDAVPCRLSARSENPRLGSSIEVTMAGDLLAGGVDPGSNQMKGKDTIETFHWLSQIGAATSR